MRESATDSTESDTDASDMEWHSTTVSMSRLSPAAEADIALADLKIGDGANTHAASHDA